MEYVNSKGQMGMLKWIAGLIVFVLIWGIWLGKFINDWARDSIAVHGYTGADAFFLSYLNLWIFLLLLISIAFAYYMVSG